MNYNGITFTRVAYVNGLKHNLISISQLCDANFNVLFTKTQETIFNQNNEIMLIVPRRRYVYVVDMSSYNEESNACFFAKASSSINWLWHKRLSHLNFKNINKLAKQNLVTGLPSLKMENLNDEKVKELRSDNGTEFENHKLEDFYDEKGISQNFSSPFDDHPVQNKPDEFETADDFDTSDDFEPADTIVDVFESQVVTISNVEPSTTIIPSSAELIEAFEEEDWIIAMQEKLNQFERNK
ncbi:retrovirus-related pol polyprotein from transposon TNT 1-94, partial [Tanacetum coccineum]